MKKKKERLRKAKKLPAACFTELDLHGLSYIAVVRLNYALIGDMAKDGQWIINGAVTRNSACN